MTPAHDAYKVKHTHNAQHPPRRTKMATDIRLDEIDGNWIMLQSAVLKSTASDFMLDAPGRRQTADGFRRALVHNDSDGLTLNFAGDYPGGVVVEGDLNVTGQIRSHRLFQLLNQVERLEDQLAQLLALQEAVVVPFWQSLEQIQSGQFSADKLGLIVKFRACTTPWTGRSMFIV